MTTNNTNIKTLSETLQDCLVYNNRFANIKLSAKQLDAKDFKAWTALINTLHKEAYSVYETCENSDLKVESTSVNKDALYVAIRNILTEIGDVNGHKLYATEEFATALVGYAGKRANSDSPALQLCLSKIRNNNNLLNQYAKLNGVNPEAIAKLEEELSVLEAEKSALLEQADNRIKAPTRTSENAFRLDVEHYLARTIAGQQAKSWEELEAEAEERRKARREATKAKKAAKAENK